jgi:hypothetical protein
MKEVEYEEADSVGRLTTHVEGEWVESDSVIDLEDWQ